MRHFDLPGFLSSFSQYNITEIAIIAPIAVAMITSPITKSYDLSSMESVGAGGAPLAKETQERFKKLLAKERRVTPV
jgi:4-coumarate--CoA ligase